MWNNICSSVIGACLLLIVWCICQLILCCSLQHCQDENRQLIKLAVGPWIFSARSVLGGVCCMIILANKHVIFVIIFYLYLFCCVAAEHNLWQHINYSCCYPAAILLRILLLSCCYPACYPAAILLLSCCYAAQAAILLLSCCYPAAILLLSCCYPAAILLLSCCYPAAILKSTTYSHNLCIGDPPPRRNLFLLFCCEAAVAMHQVVHLVH